MDPIRIFIGAKQNQWLSNEVLRWSIQRRTQSDFEIKELIHLPIRLTIQKATGVSFYRFSIPEICAYRGRAIYLDASLVVLCDIQELYSKEMGEHGALARPFHMTVQSGYYTSVMLLNCEKLKHWEMASWAGKIKQNTALYQETLWGTPKGLNATDFGVLETEWNVLDQWNAQTKILHYTDSFGEPWKKPGHPFARHFLAELKSAIEEEEIPTDAIEREIKRGHVYPQILKDIALL